MSKKSPSKSKKLNSIRSSSLSRRSSLFDISKEEPSTSKTPITKLAEKICSKNGPKLSDRRCDLKIYKDCLSQNDLITWLITNNEATNEESASYLYEILLKKKYLIEITDSSLKEKMLQINKMETKNVKGKSKDKDRPDRRHSLILKTHSTDFSSADFFTFDTDVDSTVLESKKVVEKLDTIIQQNLESLREPNNHTRLHQRSISYDDTITPFEKKPLSPSPLSPQASRSSLGSISLRKSSQSPEETPESDFKCSIDNEEGKTTKMHLYLLDDSMLIMNESIAIPPRVIPYFAFEAANVTRLNHIEVSLKSGELMSFFCSHFSNLYVRLQTKIQQAHIYSDPY